ncbi:hypothetical protein CLIB1423_10S01530 [[Candida] railenensis]|uniref:Uncharacterized protein n=1 Tax=[Candida] railenensis TaxID=45579 RepID=A0A9P0VYU3_9ASCO|nr:hypothetical protein CLIB1423_10S01530 [[Candida] railenensis]
MFHRRAARTTHTTAYTGVNHAAGPNNQPDNHAMAAALTIGQKLKENGNVGISAVQHQQPIHEQNSRAAASRSQSVRRYSLQPPPKQSEQQQQTTGRRSSLLKRSTSITTKPQAGSNAGAKTGANSPGNAFSNFASSSHNTHQPPISRNTSVARRQSVDSTEYSNHASMHDLKLQQISPQRNNAPPVVKMVKKYVPTANGIQIIEVPEESFQKEIARSNSLRSNNSFVRSASMRKLNNSPSLNKINTSSRGKLATGAPGSRLSSLIEKRPLRPMKEESPTGLSESKELDSLDLEIEKERKKVEELERKKKEFAKLKEQRLRLQQEAEAAATANEAESEAESAAEAHEEHILDPTTVEKVVAATTPAVDPHQVVVDELDKKDNNHDSIEPSIVIGEDDYGIEEVSNSNSDSESPSLAKHLRPKFDDRTVIIEPTNDQITPPPEIVDHESLQIPMPSGNGGSSSSSLRSIGSYDSNGFPKSALKQPVKSAMKNSAIYSNSSITSSSNSNSNSNAAQQAYLSLATAENTRLNSKLSSSQLQVEQHHSIPQQQHTPQKQEQVAKRLSLRKAPAQQQQQQYGANGFAKTLRPQSTLVENGVGRQDQHHYPQKAVGGGAAAGMSGRSLRERPASYVAPIAPHPALQPGYQSPSKVRAADLYARANARPMSTFKPIERKSSFSREESEVRNGNNGKPVTNGNGKTAPPPASTQRLTLRGPHQVQPTRIKPQQQPAQAQVNKKTEPPNPYALKNGSATVGSPQNIENSKNGGFRSRLLDSDEETSIASISHKDNNTTNINHSSSHRMFNSRFNDSDDEIDNSVLPSPVSRPSQTSERLISLREDKTKSKSQKKPDDKEKKKFGGKLRKLFGKN